VSASGKSERFSERDVVIFRRWLGVESPRHRASSLGAGQRVGILALSGSEELRALILHEHPAKGWIVHSPSGAGNACDLRETSGPCASGTCSIEISASCRGASPTAVLLRRLCCYRFLPRQASRNLRRFAFSLAESVISLLTSPQRLVVVAFAGREDQRDFATSRGS